MLRDAARAVGNYRLVGRHPVRHRRAVPDVRGRAGARARAARWSTARPKPKTGALVSAVAGLALPGLNHTFEVVGGVREEECRALMQEFFKARRQV